MSAEFGGGSTEGQPMAQDPQDAGQRVIADLFYAFAAYLFDYCEGLLRDPAKAADAVRDTLILADAEIGKLRDPDRLRVWLYSIARRQCLRQLPRLRELPRHSEVPAADDFFEDLVAAADADTGEFEIPDLEAEEHAREILLVVTAALDGLSDRDHEVLNLAFRHGFAVSELATTLGVSGRRARALLSGASTRFGQSAAAVVVLRAGWAGCQVPDTIVGEWDPASPPLTPRLRQRLSRHIESCDNCSRSRGGLIVGPELLGVVPLAIPPVALRERITRTVFDAEPGTYPRGLARRVGKLDDDGFPAQPMAWRSTPRVVMASAAAVLLVAAAALVHTFAGAPAVGTHATAADVARGIQAPALANSSLNSRSGRGSRGGRQALVPFPGVLTPSQDPVGVLPVPTPAPKPPHRNGLQPSNSPSPTPTRSHKPKPSPSPTQTITDRKSVV